MTAIFNVMISSIFDLSLLDLGRANIGILVDGVEAQNFGFVRRMVYNLIRMYSLSGSYVTIIVYGSKPFRVANFVQLRNARDIKKLCLSMPKVANGVRKTGAALQSMVSRKKNTNLLYFTCFYELIKMILWLPVK